MNKVWKFLLGIEDKPQMIIVKSYEQHQNEQREKQKETFNILGDLFKCVIPAALFLFIINKYFPNLYIGALVITLVYGYWYLNKKYRKK